MGINNPGTPILLDEGVIIAIRRKINFTGTGVTAVDDAGNDRVNVAVSAGVGGGDMLKAVYDPNDDGIIATAQLAATVVNRGALDSVVLDVTSMLNNDIFPLTVGKAGWGYVQIGDNEEWAAFSFSSAGVVNLMMYSANVTATGGTAGKFNIYDAGAGVAFENKLGNTKKVAYEVKYYTP
jgi:hypothetical protein